MADTTPPTDLAPVTPIPPYDPYSWQVAGKKVAYGLARFIITVMTTGGIGLWFGKRGIVLDPVSMQGPLSLVIFAGLAWLHDYLKVKKGIKWL